MRLFLIRAGLILALPYVVGIAFVGELYRSRSLMCTRFYVRAELADFWDLWENLHDA